jgi:hypothetical protein
MTAVRAGRRDGVDLEAVAVADVLVAILPLRTCPVPLPRPRSAKRAAARSDPRSIDTVWHV